MDVRLEQQSHGYKNGHQLLASSVRLERIDQDVIDRLSDLSGPLGPREIFDPYLTAYPLPSGAFYVLARTWQDLKATRAGCVLTRSLLVPMTQWETLNVPASLVDYLVPVEKQNTAVESIDFHDHAVQLPRVSSTKTASLVEALFLESRKPIVLFGEMDSILIAERLLTAFWPALRRTFSLCTLAFAPRTVNGKSFDLMFAPRSARSHFSQWEGRIVEEFQSRDMSRHRWTAVTTKHIFEDDLPSLLSLDALGILREDARADESSLRLTLLWNELLEKSESSPTAILGLLDISNSRGKSSADVLLRLTPLVVRGIELANESMSPPEALRFLLTLSGKFPLRRPPIEILTKIRKVLSLICERDPQAAVFLLLEPSLRKQTHAPIVTAGIGDGLARLSDGLQLLTLASKLSSEDELRLLAYSRAWAKAVMKATKTTPTHVWTEMLGNALQYPDGALRAKARRHVIPLMNVPSHAPLLAAMLRDGDNDVLFSVTEHIRDTTHFSIPEFDEPLRRAARGTEGILGLRRTVLAGEETSNSDRFLLATIGANSNDIGWLFREEGLHRRRRLNLLNAALSSASERDLQLLAQDELLSAKIEETLVEELPSTAKQLARVLTSGNAPVGRLLRNGCRVLPLVESGLKADLAIRMLTLGLSSAGSSENTLLRELIAESANFVDPHRLIALAIPWTAKPQRLSDNVVLLNEADSKVRTGILAEIEELTDRLIRSRYEPISEELAKAWADLLADSGSINQRAQTNAAGSILSFAIAQRNAPVSRLIVVAFPIVYAQLGAGNEMPGLFSFIFTDWDRCKTARKDIVYAFLHSSWPPIDLIKAVEPTGDTGPVLKRLLRDRDGEAFIMRLQRDASKLSAQEKRRIETAINTAINGLQTKRKDE